MFVSSEPVAIRLPDTPENVIYIRPKMDFGTQNQVLGALGKLDQRGRVVTLDLGAYLLELGVANIVGWDGPAFAGTPCTPENIRRLDPDDPLVNAALDEIGRRNPQRQSAEKN